MLRRALKVVFVNLLVLFGAAVVLELAFGTWFSTDPLEILNIQRNQTIHVDAAPLYAGGHKFTYERNRWGFRGNAIEPATIDIVTIGGSTTNQIYLPLDETWQAVMERRLAALGHPAVIANAGVDGQSSAGMLFDVQQWLTNVPGLKPKIILGYVGVNDTAVSFLAIDKLAYSGKLKWLRDHSALLRFGRVVDGLIRARAARLTHDRVDYGHAVWTDHPNFPDNRSARPQASTDAYAQRLNALADAIEQLGARPVFVTQWRGDVRKRDGKLEGIAADHGLNALDEARLLDAFNKTLLDVCARRHIACFDLAADVRFTNGDFYDLLHNTPQGAEKIGNYLADKLNEGIWPPPSASR